MARAAEINIGVVPLAEAAGHSGIEFLERLMAARLPAPPFAQTTDIWPVSAEVGRVVFEGKPSARFYNPMGLVHGGWIAGLLDTAMACAVHSALPAGKGYSTIELKSVFVRPVYEQTGTLRCEGVLLHAGRRVAHAEGKVFDADGTLIAYGSEACQVIDLPPGG